MQAITCGLGITIVIAGSFLTATPAKAEVSNPFDGVYIAAGLGLKSQDWTVALDGTDENRPFHAGRESDGRGLSGGLTAGYGIQVFGPYYVGAEIDIAWFKGQDIRTAFADPATGTAGVAMTRTPGHSFSPMLRLGYVISPKALIYARIGFAASSLFVKLAGVEAAEPNEIYGSDGERHWLRQPKIGLGVELKLPAMETTSGPLGDRLFVRADGSYTFAGSSFNARSDPRLGDGDFKISGAPGSSGSWDFRLSIGVRL